MAKKEESTNYGALIRELREKGPERLYLLWGPEDYLREQFFGALKKACLPDGEDDFSYKRFNGPELDLLEMKNAVDSVPFMSERTLVEMHGVDINKIKEQRGDEFSALAADIPDYCTVAFVEDSTFEPDGRGKAVKALRKFGREIKFTAQQESTLITWIQKRFAAEGKTADTETAKHLIFVSGSLMNRLIPEIEKVAAYAGGERVTRADVEAVAHHIPEARVFDMTDKIAAGDNAGAMSVLSEVLADRDSVPIVTLAALGAQMRRLYTARLAREKGLGRSFVEENSGLKFGFLVDRLISSAGSFSLTRLRRAVEICCETDYAMKSSSTDDAELLKEAVVRIAAGEE
jgi:DNA polymerase-3 subunit delta